MADEAVGLLAGDGTGKDGNQEGAGGRRRAAHGFRSRSEDRHVFVFGGTAGVDQLTRVLALEWGADGIRVNAISPGPTEGTEGFTRLMAADADSLAAAIRHVPLRRLGQLGDIADLALFLASERAGYISGEIIPCDGGGALESVKPALEAAAAREL